MNPRKPLEDLTKETSVVMHELIELGQQSAMSTLEYVKNCVNLVLPFKKFITTQMPGYNANGLHLATKKLSDGKIVSIWLSIPDKQPAYCLISQGSGSPIDLPKAVELFNEELEQSGQSISDFVNNVVRPEIKKQKDALPTEKQLRQNRKKFLLDLAGSFQSEATELRALVDKDID